MLKRGRKRNRSREELPDSCMASGGRSDEKGMAGNMAFVELFSH